jgi:parallel beta-helix repeat protein
LYIDGYTAYSIEDCNISNNGYAGVKIYNSGGTYLAANKTIKGNTITSNGLTNQSAGIEIYASCADIIDDNIITNNYYGITSLNSSHVKLRGNSSATYVSETQNISDNTTNQVYATNNSFPYQFKWNAIIDENNMSPLVYYSFTFGGALTLHVENNYWGNNFTPSTDLYPSNRYAYNPIWTLLPGKSGDENALIMNLNNLDSGMYFYHIFINGQSRDYKQMLIIKK